MLIPCWRCGSYALLLRYADGEVECATCGASPTPPRPPTPAERHMAEHDGQEGRRREINKLAQAPCVKWAGPCGECPLPDCFWEHRGPKRGQAKVTIPP